MNHTAEILPLTQQCSYFGPATLLSNEQQDGTAEVCWQTNGLKNTAIARIAVARFSPLRSGDEVLVTAQSAEEIYITGLLSKPQSVTKLQTQGAYAKLIEDPETKLKETLQVYTSNDELLFSYNPSTQTTRLNITKGNLELSTEDGDIQLSAANKIRLNGQSLDMEINKLKLHAGYANFVFDRLETTTNTLVENAKNVYRNVKQLTQLRSGRMRTLVDETYHFKANKALLKTEEDYKIKAEKIHLG